ncbi:MAG: tetratricopeptide repeat protein [Gammaproteobacteria bacterium]|nr:tetratricopeptide repeat protein [Gammaproteobacteria bacterium]
MDEELREVKNALRLAKMRNRFRIEQSEAVRPEDMRRALLEYAPAYVHFSGHATHGGIQLEDEAGNSKLVDGAALAGLFKLFSDTVQCVLLNACYSENQARSIVQHIPYVIGMSQPIGDRAAVQFAAGFYDAVGHGKSIDFAYELGCNGIHMDGSDEYSTPVLLVGGTPRLEKNPRPAGADAQTSAPKTQKKLHGPWLYAAVAGGIFTVLLMLSLIFSGGDKRLSEDDLMQQAQLRVEQGDYAAARKLLGKAVRGYSERIKGIEKNDPEAIELGELKLQMAGTQAALGTSYQLEFKYEKARSYFHRAAKLIPLETGESEYELALGEYLDLEGWMAFKRGNYDEAAEKLEQALSLRTEHLDISDPKLDETYNHLAETYREAAHYQKAQNLYTKLTDDLEGALKYAEKEKQRALRLLLAKVWNNTGQLFAETTAEYDKAREYYQKSLDIRTRILGPETAETAETLHNLAALDSFQGRCQAAAQGHERVLEIKRKILAGNHPSIAFTLHNLGVIYAQSKLYDKAEQAFAQALKIKKAVLGKQHKSVAAIYDQMAQMYQQQGDYTTPFGLYQEALKVREKNLRPNHPDIALNLNNLADLHEDRKAYPQAAELFERAAKVLEVAKGTEHPETLAVWKRLAVVLAHQANGYYLQKQYARAVPLYKQTREVYQRCCQAQASDQFITDLERYYKSAQDKIKMRKSKQ